MFEQYRSDGKFEVKARGKAYSFLPKILGYVLTNLARRYALEQHVHIMESRFSSALREFDQEKPGLTSDAVSAIFLCAPVASLLWVGILYGISRLCQ